MKKRLYLAIEGLDPKRVSDIFLNATDEDVKYFHIDEPFYWGDNLLTGAVRKVSQDSENIEKIVEILIRNGADVNAGVTARPPLNCVYYPKVAKILLDNGANINGKDRNGWTPLHRAVYEGNQPLVEFLVARGANLLSESNKGQKPIDLLRENHSEELKTFVQQKTEEAENKEKDKKALGISKEILERLALLSEIVNTLFPSEELAEKIQEIAKQGRQISKAVQRTQDERKQEPSTTPSMLANLNKGLGRS